MAVDFILSLPKWALGLILLLALAGRYVAERLRASELEGEELRAGEDDPSDAC